MQHVDMKKVQIWILNELSDDQNYGQTYGQIDRVRLVKEMIRRENEPELAPIKSLTDRYQKLTEAVEVVNIVVRNWEADDGWDEATPITIWDGGISDLLVVDDNGDPKALYDGKGGGQGRFFSDWVAWYKASNE